MLKRIILFTTLAVIIVGLISSFLLWKMPDSYTATAYLIMTPIPLSTKDIVPSILTDRGDIPYRVSFLSINDIPPFPTPDYELIFNSDEILEKILLYVSQREEYKDEKLSRTKLRNSMEIKTKIFFQGTNQLQYQRVITLSFTSPNPKLSAEVCNYWAQLGMEKIEELKQNIINESLDYIQQTLDEKEKLYYEKINELKQLESNFYLPSMEQKIQDYENQITNFKIQKLNLDLEIERLNKESEFTPNKNLHTDNSTSSIQEEPHQKILELQNEIKIKLAEKESLQKLIEQLETELSSLKKDYAEKKQQKKILENESTLLRQQIDNLKITRENALANLAKSQSELKFASKALTPRQKSGPPRTLYLACIVVLTAVAVPTIYIATLVLNYYLNKLEKEFIST